MPLGPNLYGGGALYLGGDCEIRLHIDIALALSVLKLGYVVILFPTFLDNRVGGSGEGGRTEKKSVNLTTNILAHSYRLDRHNIFINYL